MALDVVHVVFEIFMMKLITVIFCFFCHAQFEFKSIDLPKQQ